MQKFYSELDEMIQRGDSKKMYSKADKDVLTGFIKPPKFLWLPSNHLLRVYILRACYIKKPKSEDNQNFLTHLILFSNLFQYFDWKLLNLYSTGEVR